MQMFVSEKPPFILHHKQSCFYYDIGILKRITTSPVCGSMLIFCSSGAMLFPVAI
jgi:hypothetical protein